MKEELQTYRCTATRQSVGYESEDESGPVHQWNGKDCVLENGTVAYTSLLPGEDRGWLRLFAVPNGHGSTYLGFHKGANFDLEEIEDGET
jgi:hypothetical protein